MPTTRQFPTPDTSTPLPKRRKDLSAPGLLRAIRGAFTKIADSRSGCTIPQVDGTGLFASNAVSCLECCHKRSGGKTLYYPQRLAAVIAPPERNTVRPLRPEAVTRQGGGAQERRRAQRRQAAAEAGTGRPAQAEIHLPFVGVPCLIKEGFEAAVSYEAGRHAPVHRVS